MGSYRIVQTIYTTEPFAQLRDKVSVFFSKRRFVLGEDYEDSLVREPLLPRWRLDEEWESKCSAVVYPSRMHYSLVGSGTLILLRNGRRSSADELPETVSRFFSKPASSVSVETHNYFIGDGYTIAYELARALSKNHQPVLFSIDDELIAVKSNPYLSDHDRLVKVEAAAEGFRPPASSYPALESALHQRLGDRTWRQLSLNAQAFLVSAMVVFDSYDGASSLSLETSPAIIALSKTLEDTVVERLQKPFRAAVQQSGTLISSSSDKRLNKLRDFARRNDSRSLELGTFASQVLHLAEHDVSTLPPTASRYHQFITGLSGTEYLQYELPRELLGVTRNYRNPAAHPEPMSFPQLSSFMTLLLGNEAHTGLLKKVIDTTNPVRG